MAIVDVGSGPARLTHPVGQDGNADDHVLGPATARVTLVEYGDFECPQCGRAYPIVKKLLDDFARDVRFVYRHFPLTSSHPHAQHAAEAAEWAGALGVFWPMHDALFEHQHALADADILALARGLGLPAAALGQAWAAHTFIPRVKRHFSGGLASGVKGTPAFFIDGLRHEGLGDAVSLGGALERALQRSG